MNDEKRKARVAAIAALDQARLDVERYIGNFASREECAELVGVLPDLHELGRRFEWLTNPERDNEPSTVIEGEPSSGPTPRETPVAKK